MDSPGRQTVHLREYEPVAAQVLGLFPETLIKGRLIVPLALREGRLIAAMPRTEGLAAPGGLETLAHCPVDLVFAPIDEIEAFIASHYSHAEPVLDHGAPAMRPSERPIERPLPAPVSVAPLGAAFVASASRPAAEPRDEFQQRLHRLLAEAAAQGATDVIFDGDKGRAPRVRLRVRGALVSAAGGAFGAEDVDALVRFLIATGRGVEGDFERTAEAVFDHDDAGRSWDVSGVATERAGFSLVTLHLRRREEPAFAPESWGLAAPSAGALARLLDRESGLLVFAGPDASSVQKTFLGALQRVVSSERQAVLIDDGGAGARGVASFGGRTSDEREAAFDRALAHRVDAIAIDGVDSAGMVRRTVATALGGRLVLARVAAPDTAEAILRLARWGRDVHALASALTGLLAQRTLRLLCESCRERDPITRDRLKDLALPISFHPAVFYRAKGCAGCAGTGFGREESIFEWLEATDDLRARLTSDLKADALRSFLRANGVMTFRQSAVHRAATGQTSLAEVLRATA